MLLPQPGPIGRRRLRRDRRLEAGRQDQHLQLAARLWMRVGDAHRQVAGVLESPVRDAQNGRIAISLLAGEATRDAEQIGQSEDGGQLSTGVEQDAQLDDPLAVACR